MAIDKVSTADDFTRDATLLDGTAVTIRRLNTDDYDAVVALALTLDERERYMRFFTAHPAYIGEWALSLTAPAAGMVALGAFEAGELIGVANYAQMDQPGYAEVAVVVAHDQHERGVGTALLRALGHLARNAGQHHFIADILAENRAMCRVISDAGWPTTRHNDAGVLSIDIDLDNLR
ncbi:acetyltransferase [Mycobacterium sp. 852013-50091_SCH5140682]|uniref:GNAT family N-acetyltransferase n=1 Tax=Mycobacterium sp. 852013-50091_SCH5140682 TaxID=1834109 RepID=UPI0007EB57FC|nr:GNAT family N-acetyltransferase [Mycobacterium sp. 852013-50091_SCH5140682]OBC00361.1 acetyltransferase [Mycobacterium sp. 852013-50091_SCH5140682]